MIRKLSRLLSHRYADDPEATFTSFMVTENGVPHSIFTPPCFVCVLYWILKTHTHAPQSEPSSSTHRYADDPEAITSSSMVIETPPQHHHHRCTPPVSSS
jgi:hypothetical protein